MVHVVCCDNTGKRRAGFDKILSGEKMIIRSAPG